MVGGCTTSFYPTSLTLNTGRRTHPGPPAWLAGSGQPGRLRDEKYPHFFGQMNFFLKQPSRLRDEHKCLWMLGKAPAMQLYCLEGKMATKLANLRCFVAILHLSQYARFCRLWAILKQGLQAPRGTLQPGGRVSITLNWDLVLFFYFLNFLSAQQLARYGTVGIKVRWNGLILCPAVSICQKFNSIRTCWLSEGVHFRANTFLKNTSFVQRC